ncbi:MAG: MoaD/ThiS family protein, partial [Candidatus Methanomethylicaceae archaeon]
NKKEQYHGRIRMKVLVKFLTSYREIVGKYKEELELVPGSTVRDIISIIITKYPSLKLDKETILILNQKIVKDNLEVKDRDVIVFSPPLGGG